MGSFSDPEHNQCRPLVQPHETKNKETGESQGKLLENSEIIDVLLAAKLMVIRYSSNRKIYYPRSQAHRYISFNSQGRQLDQELTTQGKQVILSTIHQISFFLQIVCI